VTDALGDIERYTYDPAGKMRAKVDKDGYETAFHYGTNGQVEEICYADGRKVSLTYNAIRQLEEVKDWLGTTKIAMDEAGRIVSVTDPYGKPWDMNGEAWARERQFFIQMEKRPYMNTMKPCS
jgi:YD repeat-containing protein